FNPSLDDPPTVDNDDFYRMWTAGKTSGSRIVLLNLNTKNVGVNEIVFFVDEELVASNVLSPVLDYNTWLSTEGGVIANSGGQNFATELNTPTDLGTSL